VQREAGLQHQLSAAQVAMIALGSTIGTGLFFDERDFREACWTGGDFELCGGSASSR